MLLGYRGFNPRLGYYFRFIDSYPRYEWIDIRTLEPLTVLEQERRARIRRSDGSSEIFRDWYND